MNLILKFAAWSISLLKKIYNFLDAVTSGFWLGVLNEENIYRYNDLHYDKGTTYVNDTYNLSGLQAWEYERIKKYFSKSRTFLILAAGGGRETAALRKWGAEVDSFECSERLVEYGNDFFMRNGIDAKINYLSKNSVPGELKRYNGIIIGWGAYTHIQGSKTRIAFLSALKPYCMAETHIMISFLLNDGSARKDSIIKNVSNFFRSFTGRDKTEAGDRLLSYYAHFFKKAEIESELNASGFSMVDYYDGEYGCAVGKLKI